MFKETLSNSMLRAPTIQLTFWHQVHITGDANVLWDAMCVAPGNRRWLLRPSELGERRQLPVISMSPITNRSKRTQDKDRWNRPHHPLPEATHHSGMSVIDGLLRRRLIRLTRWFVIPRGRACYLSWCFQHGPPAKVIRDSARLKRNGSQRCAKVALRSAHSSCDSTSERVAAEQLLSSDKRRCARRDPALFARLQIGRSVRCRQSERDRYNPRQ